VVWRIRDRATFEALRRDGQRSRRGHITVTFVVTGDESAPRVAYAVGKRVGGAVVRNRLRRRLRTVVADASASLAPGAYLVAAGREAAGLPYEDLKAQVTAAMTSASRDRRQ
jgi:ribonuclease P protein component